MGTSSTMELVNNVMELVLETSSTMELVNNVMELANIFLELVNKNFRNGACKQFFGACKQCAPEVPPAPAGCAGVVCANETNKKKTKWRAFFLLRIAGERGSSHKI